MKALFQTDSSIANNHIGILTDKTAINKTATNQTKITVLQDVVQESIQIDELTQLPTKWQGLTRQQCLDFFAKKDTQVTKFAHWLGVPSLNLLLTFKQQLCVDVQIISYR
ncbi:MAG: hypothetical protein CR966_00230 [Pseudomonadales bacterium]|nr:MAG: hypothetical protein CR966_00230 [Pseudomonadales bacterium]